ncbi:MAG: indolepyruvate oxidoreductase subunit beta [bacterium]
MDALNTDNTKKSQNILICGIGGQGVVLAGKIISLAAFKSGLDIKTSEVHGMSQRGGSVSTHIRFGEKIFSPLISKNMASVILSFDIFETVRYLKSFANDKTIIISSNYGKMPSWTSKNKNGKIEKNGTADIENITALLKAGFKHLHLIDDKKIAGGLGNIKVSNIISIGLLSAYTGISEELWLKVIEKNVPEKTKELNLKAFLIGRNELISQKQ